jgi:hypothetical protein
LFIIDDQNSGFMSYLLHHKGWFCKQTRTRITPT